MQYISSSDSSGGLEFPSDIISMGPLLSIDTKLCAQRGAVWELEGVEVMYHYYIININQKYAVQKFFLYQWRVRNSFRYDLYGSSAILGHQAWGPERCCLGVRGGRSYAVLQHTLYKAKVCCTKVLLIPVEG